MPRLLTLPVVAMLALAGIGAGVYLGNASVRSVKPSFFAPPVSVASAYRNPNDAQGSAIPVPAEESRYALGAPCIGCGIHPAAGQPENEGMPESYYAASLGAEYGYRPVGGAEVEPLPPEPLDAERAAVERYASYPVADTESDLRAIERRAEVEAARAAVARANAEALRRAEENAVPRGPEQLIY